MIEKIQTMQTEPLEIIYPDGKTIALLPVPRSRLLELRGLFVALQSIWLSAGFSTGETIVNSEAWKLMGAIAGMLPRSDAPQVLGFDLDLLGADYAQLESLFFADYTDISPEKLHGWQIITFNLERFCGCKLLALHCINPRAVILAADDRRKAVQKAEPEPIASYAELEGLKEAATQAIGR